MGKNYVFYVLRDSLLTRWLEERSPLAHDPAFSALACIPVHWLRTTRAASAHVLAPPAE